MKQIIKWKSPIFGILSLLSILIYIIWPFLSINNFFFFLFNKFWTVKYLSKLFFILFGLIWILSNYNNIKNIIKKQDSVQKIFCFSLILCITGILKNIYELDFSFLLLIFFIFPFFIIYNSFRKEQICFFRYVKLVFVFISTFMFLIIDFLLLFTSNTDNGIGGTTYGSYFLLMGYFFLLACIFYSILWIIMEIIRFMRK